MEYPPAAGYVTDVAYVPGFYANLAPIALRSVAAVNRVAPPSGRTFRYLELGCGLGRTLTTLAAACPEAEFVGVDINPEHTASAIRESTAGQLVNVRVETCGFDGLPPDLGRFDYVAVHGVYSWVSAPIREQVIAAARTHLADGGLLVLSYNALPGWAHLQPIRGILRQYAALRGGDSLQRVREAVAYLVFLRDRQAKYFTDNPGAAAYVDTLRNQDVRYLAHEYLNEDWTSFYFAEVAGTLGRAGLSFVGSLPFHTNFWDLCVRPEFQELFRTTTDRLVTEAHKDFCANTAFRWDVYAISPRRLAALDDRMAAVADLHLRLARPGIRLPHKTELGPVASTLDGPIYEWLVSRLAAGSLPMAALVTGDLPPGTTREAMARAIDAGVATGLLDVTAHPVPAPPAVRPSRVGIPCPFNRGLLATDALGGRPIALASRVTGTGHVISDLDAAILDELAADGNDGIAARLEARLAVAGRSLMHQGAVVADAADREQLLRLACEAFGTATLPQLLQLGIVTAG